MMQGSPPPGADDTELELDHAQTSQTMLDNGGHLHVELRFARVDTILCQRRAQIFHRQRGPGFVLLGRNRDGNYNVPRVVIARRRMEVRDAIGRKTKRQHAPEQL